MLARLIDRAAATVRGREERLLWLAISAVVLLRLGLSLHEINRPGLHYDESLFINAATKREPGVFIDRTLFGAPVMVFPYIGALKSYLWTPIFAIFGTSAGTVRFPAVLLVTGGLVAMFAGLRTLINTPVALPSFVALSFDGTVFWLSRDDVGPIAVSLFLKGIAVLFVARWVQTHRARWVAALVVVLGLGVWDKLNFIWTVNALAVVSAVLIWRHRGRLREFERSLAIWAGGLFGLYSATVAYYVGHDIANTQKVDYTGSLLGFTWPRFEHGTELVLSGSWFYDYALAPTGPSNGIVVLTLALAGAGAAAALTSWPPLHSPVIASLAAMTLLTWAQILVTAQATAGWHYVAIQPMITIVAAYGAYAAGRAVGFVAGRPLAWAAGLTVLTGLLVLGHDYRIMRRHFSALNHEPRNVAWSPAIYGLERFVKHHPGTYFTADWGLQTPLLALTPDGTKVRELAFQVRGDPGGAAKAIAAEPGTRYVVTHPADREVFAGAHAALTAAVAVHLQPVGAIDGPGGGSDIEIFRWR